MITSLRAPAAAVLLLLPAAMTLVAVPAAAQQRAVVAEPALRTLSVTSTAGVAPGAVLRVQLQATPGARNVSAALRPGGVRVVLREQAPGRYAGSYTVRRGDRIDPQQRITARATYGDRVLVHSFSFPPALQAQAMGSGQGDERPPRITELTPAEGERFVERGRTFIHARLDDRGTGVDPRSVRLFVDGLDVTADARITADEVSYRERLGRGTHRAELLVKDRAGNVSRVAWSFVAS